MKCLIALPARKISCKDFLSQSYGGEVALQFHGIFLGTSFTNFFTYSSFTSFFFPTFIFGGFQRRAVTDWIAIDNFFPSYLPIVFIPIAPVSLLHCLHLASDVRFLIKVTNRQIKGCNEIQFEWIFNFQMNFLCRKKNFCKIRSNFNGVLE